MAHSSEFCYEHTRYGKTQSFIISEYVSKEVKFPSEKLVTTHQTKYGVITTHHTIVRFDNHTTVRCHNQEKKNKFSLRLYC